MITLFGKLKPNQQFFILLGLTTVGIIVVKAISSGEYFKIGYAILTLLVTLIYAISALFDKNIH